MTKDRFLAFTDAIIAIIATIMVLEFRTPKLANFAALKELAVPVLAYAISFFMILGVWYNHHQLFRDITRITPRIFAYNSVWLFVMSLFPFTTGWVGAEPNEVLPELLYIVITMFWTASFHMMERELRRENPDAQRNEMTHTMPGAAIFALLGLSAIIVWFFPPIGIISIGAMGIYSVGQLFLRN